MSGARRTIVRACTVIVVRMMSVSALAADKPRFTRTEVEIDIPDVTLINQ